MSDGPDGNRLDSTISSLVEDAITLAKNYKAMLFQGDEVDHRIKLWREAIDICNINSNSMSYIPIQRAQRPIDTLTQLVMSTPPCANFARNFKFLTSSPVVVYLISIPRLT
jgi:hypothetical protein